MDGRMDRQVDRLILKSQTKYNRFQLDTITFPQRQAALSPVLPLSGLKPTAGTSCRCPILCLHPVMCRALFPLLVDMLSLPASTGLALLGRCQELPSRGLSSGTSSVLLPPNSQGLHICTDSLSTQNPLLGPYGTKVNPWFHPINSPCESCLCPLVLCAQARQLFLVTP